MTDLQLNTQFSSLPADLKQEVKDFIEFLASKSKKQQIAKKERQFGAAKGFFKMHESFDDPLEDFKDYM